MQETAKTQQQADQRINDFEITIKTLKQKVCEITCSFIYCCAQLPKCLNIKRLMDGTQSEYWGNLHQSIQHKQLNTLHFLRETLVLV